MRLMGGTPTLACASGTEEGRELDDLLSVIVFVIGSPCRALPQHVITQFFGVRTHGRQCGKLAGEDLVLMGSFVLFERTPIRHNDIVVVAGSGWRERSLIRYEPGELEHLSRKESAFIASVCSFDDATEFTDGQFNVLERDSRLEYHRVEQHFGPEGECDWTEHVILLAGY